MRAFRAVAEQTSFRQAGRQLGITGSSVSKLVAALEQDLGVRLLQRTTRQVSLTAAGESFLQDCVRILDETHAAVDRLKAQGERPRGRLRVSVPTSFALTWLASQLPGFLARYPEIELDLALNDRYVDLVAERFDAAIRIGSVMPDSSLVARRLGRIPRVLVASARYLRSAPPLRTPSDLPAHNALVYSLASTGSTWPFIVDGKPVEVAVSGRLQVDNSVMLRETLRAGMGVALTPLFVVNDLIERDELVVLLPGCQPEPHGIFGVTSDRRHLPLKTRLFFEHVEAALQQTGYGSPALPAQV
jgi:DNA-binding transcriptional LysR family regulator